MNTIRTVFRTLVLLTFGLLLSTACVHVDDRLKHDLDPWVGKDVDTLVGAWGAPSSNYAMQDGTKVLTYVNDRNYSRSNGVGYASWRWGSYSFSETCKINFFTDAAQKKIDHFTTTGDKGSCIESLRELPRP